MIHVTTEQMEKTQRRNDIRAIKKIVRENSQMMTVSSSEGKSYRPFEIQMVFEKMLREL